jgi:hypothetical protein
MKNDARSAALLLLCLMPHPGIAEGNPSLSANKKFFSPANWRAFFFPEVLLQPAYGGKT